jgi:MYXO-CTERM domain-containing protein
MSTFGRSAGVLLLAWGVTGCASELKDKERFLAAQAEGGGEGPSEAASDAAPAAACPDVPQMLAAGCAGEGCHSRPAKAGALDLESPDISGRLLGVRASGGGGLLIDPSYPEQSVLYTKLLASPPFGQRMPTGAPPYDTARLACVFAWVSTFARDAGAQSDAGSPDAAAADAMAPDGATDAVPTVDPPRNAPGDAEPEGEAGAPIEGGAPNAVDQPVVPHETAQGCRVARGGGGAWAALALFVAALHRRRRPRKTR